MQLPRHGHTTAQGGEENGAEKGREIRNETMKKHGVLLTCWLLQDKTSGRGRMCSTLEY